MLMDVEPFDSKVNSLKDSSLPYKKSGYFDCNGPFTGDFGGVSTCRDEDRGSKYLSSF